LILDTSFGEEENVLGGRKNMKIIKDGEVICFVGNGGRKMTVELRETSDHESYLLIMCGLDDSLSMMPSRHNAIRVSAEKTSA
jgi:hypothetical protein